MRDRVRSVVGVRETKLKRPSSWVMGVIGETAIGEEPDVKPRKDSVDVDATSGAQTRASSEKPTSSADQIQRKAGAAPDNIVTAINMWRSGSKYDCAKHLLYSDVSYRDFVLMVRDMDEKDAIELGSILDELADSQEPSTDDQESGAGESDVPSEEALSDISDVVGDNVQ